MEDKKPSENQVQSRSSIFSIASVISLIVGLTGAVVSLYIFYASRVLPALDIEQLPSITYASTESLSGLGKVELLIDGRLTPGISALPFTLRNIGNTPISSLDKSSTYNLMGPIILELSPKVKRPSSKVLAVQLQQGSGSPLKVDFTNHDEYSELKINIRNLNVNESSVFTVLYVDDKEPATRLLGNPLLGGELTLIKDDRSVVEESWWSKFKSVLLAQGIGIIFLAQLPIVFIILAVGARNLYIEKKQDAERKNPEKQKAEAEQKHAIDADLDEKLIVLEDELRRKMQTTQVPVPMGLFETTQASVTVHDLFRESYLKKWEYTLREKYPLPKEFDDMALINKRVVTSWIGWDHYIGSALLPFGIGSTALAIFGYFLLYK